MRLFNDFFPPEISCFMTDASVDFTLPLAGPLFDPTQAQYLEERFAKEISSSPRLPVQTMRPAIATVRQVHGNRVILLTEYSKDDDVCVAEADGLITNIPHLALSIRTADCLPIFIVSEEKKTIGIFHAGWRSTQKGIVGEGLKILKHDLSCRADQLKVGLGPCLRDCCYEVTEELRAIFPEEITARGGKLFLDLALANQKQLLAAGVKEENINDHGQCTHCQKNFHSYRRDGINSGRMLSLLTRRE